MQPMQPIINGSYWMPVPPFEYAGTPSSVSWASAPSPEFKKPYFLERYINRGYQMPVLPFGYAGTPNSVTGASALFSEFNKPYFLEPYINGSYQMPVLPFGYVVTPNSLTWASALSAEFNQPYFAALQEFVARERKQYTVYPPPEQVYTWTQMCSIENVKVVILGQDPYHNVGQAHGLCFSVQKGIQPPPSLENMYKELANDIDGFEHPGHGNLTGWAKQGVLLLNAVLTVRAHTPNSHKDKGWEKFTDAVISWLNKNQDGLVFMLWGSYAQKKGAIINTKRHCVLKSTHPSPLSAYRGFLGCGHFSKANEYLKKTGQKPIDWTKLKE